MRTALYPGPAFSRSAGNGARDLAAASGDTEDTGPGEAKNNSVITREFTAYYPETTGTLQVWINRGHGWGEAFGEERPGNGRCMYTHIPPSSGVARAASNRMYDCVLGR